MASNAPKSDVRTLAMRSLRVAGIYTLVGILWILFSDQLLLLFSTDPTRLISLQTFKGTFFVLVTAVLLFFLVRHALTAEHKTKTALLVSEERLSLALRASKSGLWDYFIQTGNIYFNPDFYRVAGYEPDDFPHSYKEWRDRVHPEDISETEANFRDFVSGQKKIYETDFRFKTKAGEWLWMLAQAKIFERNPAGQPLRITGTQMDITERKLAELASMENEAKYRRTLDSMLEGCQIIGFDWRYRYLNESVKRQTRRPDINLIGKTVMECWPGITETRLFALQKNCMADRTTHQLDNEFIFPDGHRGWFRLIIQPAEEGIVIYSEDITERKQAEQKIQQLNQELEERVRERTLQLELLNQELEAFSYSVSHDLKSPLRGIDGYSRLLEEDYGDRLDGDGRLFIRNIRRGAIQMNQLIEDLLGYSRMERRSLHSSLIDLQALLQAVVEGAGLKDGLPEIQLRVMVPPLKICADREGMIMLLRNLLDNAVKFSRAAKPPTIEIGARTEADKLIIWVRDNGIGFDMKFHDRIFEIFQRLQRAEDYPGTGIGLALARKAVQRMGGQIWAESAPGAGSTFYLELPQ